MFRGERLPGGGGVGNQVGGLPLPTRQGAVRIQAPGTHFVIAAVADTVWNLLDPTYI